MNAKAKSSPPSLKTAEEFHNYGCNLWKERNRDEAFEYFEKAYEMNPDHPGIIVSYALKLLREQKFEKAEELLRKAISLKPDYAEAYDKLSYALFHTARTDEAIQTIKTAIKLQPNNAENYHKLGAFMTDASNKTEALFWQEKAVKMSPSNPYARYNYGLTLNQSGFHEEAAEQFHKIIELDPSFESAYYNIMTALEQNHKIQDINDLLEKAEKNIPGTITISIIKGRLAKREKNFDEAIKHFEEHQDSKYLSLYPDLMFELGAVYDKTKQYDKAYDAFVAANNSRLEKRDALKYPIEHYPKVITEIAEPYTREWVAGWSETYPSEKYPTPNFLVGFPRSGTTLTGQILDSHPKLFVAEEVEAIERTQQYLSSTNPNTYPGCIKTLGPGSVEKMRSVFYANHRNNAMWEEGRTLVDKHPLNMGRIGTMYRMFPDAKIIFAARHPCDCIFSSFMQNFQMNDAMVHMTTLERTIEFYMLNMDLWNKYREAMPDLNYHIIRYEDLVVDFNTEIAKMLDFLELEWDDSVLQYNKNATSKPRTNTPSYSQVIQPIYKTSTYRWEHYRKYFEPYLERLTPYIEDLGYKA